MFQYNYYADLEAERQRQRSICARAKVPVGVALAGVALTGLVLVVVATTTDLLSPTSKSTPQASRIATVDFHGVYPHGPDAPEDDPSRGRGGSKRFNSRQWAKDDQTRADAPSELILKHTTWEQEFTPPEPTAEVPAASEAATLLVSAYNADYDRITWSPWKLLAEPYKNTTLESSCIGAACKATDRYTWTVEGETVMGASVRWRFKRTGFSTVILSRIDGLTGDIVQQKSLYVMVKYVRREIRALTDNDRTRFLDALETIYRVPTDEGVLLYGDGYKGIEYFVSMHLYGAGMPECDHWHDDAGIMTHHVGFTLQLEQNLQLVDPSVSIPYWEYTKDEYEYSSLGQSPVFQDDWFGEMSPSNELHTMTTGRWAYTPVATEAWSDVHNPYGLLRTPWNTDKTPYITRHNSTADLSGTATPTCLKLAACFNSDSVADMNSCLNGGTHGPVHIKIGGEWDHPDEVFIQDWNFDVNLVLVFKTLWRKGYARLPENCTDRAQSDCQTWCPSEVLHDNNMTPYEVLEDSQALFWMARSSNGKIHYDEDLGMYRIAGMEDDTHATNQHWARLLRSLCNPGHVGEMFTSAAPYDPIFWVIHPSADRLLGWRRLVGQMKNTDKPFDETWGYTHNDTPGDDGFVCDWTDVTGFGLPSCKKDHCYGHNADDTTPFQMTLNGKILPVLTNQELYDWVHPNTEDLPYMYDNYDWPWCEVQGYTIG